MKRRKHIAWILIAACIVMLAASVLPHHHHHGLLCLQMNDEVCTVGCMDNAQTTCNCTDGTCHRHPQRCNDGCVTHFRSLMPERAQDTLSPHYTCCTLLFTATDMLSHLLFPPQPAARQKDFYLEKLHIACTLQARGLRAPPCASAC